ncbi:PREDICTED: uncharacterized protein LOC104772684 [Camelina sativa]|uniref:Uncharacterized protein LOC104772684 n=1 Tax=Camelina sativa TaxID=90675 RepID=A0ABM0Y4Y6_CAMSA|nr:PREDICTED: uncharacterized protein LOC104772684 [Camelina sativa]
MASDDSFSSAPLSISQVVALKLTESNYLQWKTQFESFLSPQMLLGYVNGSLPRPASTRSVTGAAGVTEEPNPEFEKWIRNDQLVMAWILGSLSETAIRVVYGLQSAQEVWSALAKRFNRVSTTRKFELQNKLRACLKSGKTMEDYLSELQQIFDQLDLIGFPMTDLEKIHGLLFGLGKEYETVATVIEHSMDSLPTPCYEDVVFKTAYYDRGGSNNRGGRSGGGYRGKGNYSTGGRGFQQHGSGQNSQNRGNGGTKPTCQICGKYGHSAFDCYNRYNESLTKPDLPNALAAMRVSDSEQQHTGAEWLPDSGSTAHITNTTANLQHAQPYHGNDSVMVGNGEFLPITHIGSVPLQTLSGKFLPLKDVLVCPNVAKSLLLVSKLCLDYPYSVKFDFDGVRVKDKHTKQLLTTGNLSKDHYVLDNPAFATLYSTRQLATSDY